MARASEQFQQTDIAVWGVIALVCGAVAVLSANVSAVLPQSVLAGLHKTRIEGASLDQLRIQVALLSDETRRLKNENSTMQTRFALQEQNDQESVQRIGALEVTMPRIIEALPAGASIDPSTTAAIGDGTPETFPAEGGSVSVQQRPLVPPVAEANQPLPPSVVEVAPAVPNANAFGIAIGSTMDADQVPEGWNDLSNKVGTLLLGLSPLVAPAADGTGSRILVGPISELSEASALCARLERVSIACMPMPFVGTPIAL